MKQRIVFFLLFVVTAPALRGQSSVTLANDRVRLVWQKTGAGYRLAEVAGRKGGAWVKLPNPSGEQTLLFSSEKPSDEPVETFKTRTGVDFPEENYKYQREQWRESVTAVALNRAGKAAHFFPKTAQVLGKNYLRFQSETPQATVTTELRLDENFPTDVLVSQTLTPKTAGYFSLATPTLAPVAPAQLAWATVPGYFQGDRLAENFAGAYAYGHGVPDRPVVYRERCASTLSPLVSTKSGLTLAVIPEPGLARDPWAADKITQTDWNLGLSHKNRRNELAPTLYYPVLGEPKSKLATGETVRWSFRYHFTDGDWFAAVKHAAYDVYQFSKGLALRQSRQSLTHRVERMHHYLTDPVTSLWNVEEFRGLNIGGQSYLGGVVGSNKDAMKNADYGAMWYLATATGNPLLRQNVLPYALNFKLAQQETTPGFFAGAAVGQYYLAKSKRFVEEWGEVVEPIALTYYTMLDDGNVLLFEPNNEELKNRLRLGAERLLSWQKTDGSWAVAYDRKTEAELFKDVLDLRPTFYGLLVAYRILGDEKYLAAARRGADWLVGNAVETGSYLGVCGDARYAPDFATGQTAQALLDLYDLTRHEPYKTAAIAAAKVYTTSMYTHPIPSRAKKTVNGTEREDWEIAQAGLSFEHGGIFGSATRHGPIQLASHAGLFVRMAGLTGEPFFADLARAAALGRDAFVDPKTSVASYYWNAMNRGAGPYPHHAWWQVGWITDYLLAEAELRSGGNITFPRGFVTPKVGPHQSAGFAPGLIYGEKSNLLVREGVVTPNDPNIDYVLAQSVDGKRLFVVLLNNRAQETAFRVTFNPERLAPAARLRALSDLTNRRTLDGTAPVALTLPGFGLTVLSLQLEP
jgi:hypothetical protein